MREPLMPCVHVIINLRMVLVPMLHTKLSTGFLIVAGCAYGTLGTWYQVPGTLVQEVWYSSISTKYSIQGSLCKVINYYSVGILLFRA